MTDKESEFLASLKALLVRYNIKIEKEYNFLNDGEELNYYFSNGDDIYLSIEKAYYSQVREQNA